MRRENLIKEQERNRLLENSGVSVISNADLISVDIQPEYQDGFTFYIHSFIDYLNENFESMRSLTFLFNGPELGFPDENEYKFWLMENGLDENVIANSIFEDKTYAYFRYCMNEGIDDDELVDLIKYMMSHDINDSRDINEEMWNDFMNEYNYEQSDIRDLLEVADDMIHIPDLMDFLQRYSGKIVLCGGGINECLKEVEIALMALNKKYNVLDKFVY